MRHPEERDDAKRDGFDTMTTAIGVVMLFAGLAVALVGSGGPLAFAAGAVCGAGAVLIAIGLSHRGDPEPREAVTARVIEAPPQALLDAIDDPLLLVEQRTVLAANPAALALLGDHVVGEDIRLAIRHPAAADLLAHGGTGSAGAIDVAGLGTRDRYWTLAVRPVGADRRLVILVDRSEGRAAERMRVDFVANASHELRTPLASLIGFIETLEDADQPNDAAVRRRFLGIMRGEAKRMQRLVDDLISLSRIEAERHRAPAEAVSLGALAEEAAGALGDPRVQVLASGDLPAVAGDRAQLSQLVHNLVGNALKYGDPARPVRVTIDAARGNMVRLEVADEGEGIAPEHLPRLTERFYRVDPGRSRAGGGTGLGLAIVKHIIERHRGRLDIASATGKGTRVTVLLPAARQA